LELEVARQRHLRQCRLVCRKVRTQRTEPQSTSEHPRQLQRSSRRTRCGVDVKEASTRGQSPVERRSGAPTGGHEVAQGAVGRGGGRTPGRIPCCNLVDGEHPVKRLAGDLLDPLGTDSLAHRPGSWLATCVHALSSQGEVVLPVDRRGPRPVRLPQPEVIRRIAARLSVKDHPALPRPLEARPLSCGGDLLSLVVVCHGADAARAEIDTDRAHALIPASLMVG
jgi:hypothetical protein